MTESTSVAGVHSFGEDWMQAYFDEVDRMRADNLILWYRADASFRFANHPPFRGREAIAAALRAFYATIRSMRHEKTGVWIDASEPSGVWEAIAHFETLDGRQVALPAVSVVRLENGLIRDFRFVMDAAPLSSGPR